MKYHNLFAQINFTQRHISYTHTTQHNKKIRFRFENYAETPFLPVPHYKNTVLKSYPIDDVSLSQAERCDSYPIRFSCRSDSFLMGTDPLSDMVFKTQRNALKSSNGYIALMTIICE